MEECLRKDVKGSEKSKLNPIVVDPDFLREKRIAGLKKPKSD
jgi:hypothetical protein